MVVEATGAAVMGHPATAASWLAGTLADYGEQLKPGDIILSGSFGPALSVGPGDRFTLSLDDASPLSVEFD